MDIYDKVFELTSALQDNCKSELGGSAEYKNDEMKSRKEEW